MRQEHQLREQDARESLIRAVATRQRRTERSLQRRERRAARLTAQLSRLRMARP
ncbi:hypothetical protein [Phytoactinopolyspora halotolerans]|uniref:Uncharacterized protein n=1 Tax=Phytoactinopolyspora halotolerans TaxID=1981512 RepID=A0A6L9S808_9ACTN|nr:hypothetical protein [Phytoactinopolyspora halotolerans]NEE00110.1 hypothetical protein [Phytoactinopolyspora halotolerans]